MNKFEKGFLWLIMKNMSKEELVEFMEDDEE